MRLPLYMAILAMSFIALQSTASTPGGTGESGGTGLPAAADAPAAPPPGGGGQDTGSPPGHDQPGDQLRDQSRDQSGENVDGTSRSGTSLTEGGDGHSLGSGVADNTVTKTTTTTAPAAPPANTTTRDLPSAHGPATPGHGVTSVITKSTEAAVTNGQTHAQAQITQTGIDQTDIEGRSTPPHDDKKPILSVEPRVSSAATETTTIAPAAATFTGADDPERPQEHALTDNTLTSGGVQRQQPDRLGQPQPNTATITRTQPGTHLAPPITHQNPHLNPAGTTPVSPPAPKPTPITGDNALVKTTDPKLSSPGTTPPRQNSVTGQTPSTNAAAAADPVITKSTTSTKIPARHGHNPATTNSGIKNKLHALTLKSTTSTAAPEDSPQTSLTSTTESAKEESFAPANPLPKLSKTLQHVDLKDGSIGSSLFSALTPLVTLTVMAVVPMY